MEPHAFLKELVTFKQIFVERAAKLDEQLVKLVRDRDEKARDVEALERTLALFSSTSAPTDDPPLSSAPTLELRKHPLKDVIVEYAKLHEGVVRITTIGPDLARLGLFKSGWQASQRVRDAISAMHEQFEREDRGVYRLITW